MIRHISRVDVFSAFSSAMMRRRFTLLLAISERFFATRGRYAAARMAAATRRYQSRRYLHTPAGRRGFRQAIRFDLADFHTLPFFDD
jgi:hypothetical protein